MMVSGVVWTYAIGSVAAIAATLDPNRIEYQNTMDQLNYFMRERSLQKPMRIMLRNYFEASRHVHQLNDDSELLERMSPLLQVRKEYCHDACHTGTAHLAPLHMPS